MNEFLRRNEDIIFYRFQETVNSCSDPNDLTRCFNPWYTRHHGDGTTNSAEVVDYINGQVKNQNTTQMLVGDLSLSGPLFRLPGGDSRARGRRQFRRNEQFVDNDNDFEDEAYAFTIGDKDWRGKQNVAAGFARAFDAFRARASRCKPPCARRLQEHRDHRESARRRLVGAGQDLQPAGTGSRASGCAARWARPSARPTCCRPTAP